MGMPICPRCTKTIHHEADEKCPSCGYSILQANEIFDDGLVDFPRVLDAAGALTHQERQEITQALAQMERRIRPVALCIYLIDRGRVEELPLHAHWILNHARIHHPSFGKREQLKAIEDAELRERKPGEKRPQETPQSWLESTWQSICEYFMDHMRPLPPPVRHEWMLILVMDMQLEMACFSWGYMLDPYIKPKELDKCILSAQLQFRERATVTALKKVMTKATNLISRRTRTVNKELRAAQRMSTFATAALGLLLGSSALAQDAPPTPSAEPQISAPADDGMPHWRAEDYRHLMSGDLLTGYTALFPPKPTPEEIKAERERKKQQQKEERELRRQRKLQAKGNPRLEKLAESDTKVLERYHSYYKNPKKNTLLNDPQGLLSTIEREDAEHVLRSLNANARFRIYVAVFKGEQNIPSELAVNTLAEAATQPREIAVLMRYPTGNPAGIELGYMELKPTDSQRHEWLQKVRTAAGDGSAEGLINATRCINSLITPFANELALNTSEIQKKHPEIEIIYKERKKEKKPSISEKIKKFFEDPAAVQQVLYPLIFIAMVLLIWRFINWLRTSSRLEESKADIRLSSPYGASVSSPVNYLEGTVITKEQRLF